MPKTKIDGWQCSECKHEWQLRAQTKNVVTCPKCHNIEINTF